MSLEAMAWAMDQDCDTPAEKSVLMVLGSYAGPDGVCWPGQDTIARKASCSVKTVERVLQRFVDLQWLERKPRRRRDGSRTSDLLYLKAAPNPEPREQPDTMSGRDEPTRHPVQANPTSCPDQPDTMSGLTSFEPLGEPHPPNPPVGGDQHFDEAWEAYPRIGLGSSNRDDARAAWRAAAAAIAPADLLSAVKRYAASDAATVGGGGRVPAFHRWLAKRRWEAWAPTNRPSRRGAGTAIPPDLRRAVVAEAGEPFARSYLDPAACPGTGPPTLVALSSRAAQRLRALDCLTGWRIDDPPMIPPDRPSAPATPPQ